MKTAVLRRIHPETFAVRRGFNLEQFAHGVRARYVMGCRCDTCRNANRLYANKRAKERIFHGSNGLVSAFEVRQHLLNLSRVGVGYKTAAAAADVGKTTIAQILNGVKKKVRASTAERILAIDKGCLADGALVPAGKTWRKLNYLIEEGFSKAEIARRLGKKMPALQLGKNKITALNASRVERLFVMVSR